MDQINKHEHSRSAVGLAVIRCSLFFVFVIVLIPFYTTFMVLRDNDNPGISIWWLRPIDEEDLALVEEENEQNIATQLKLRKWAKKQKELALAFVSAGRSLTLLILSLSFFLVLIPGLLSSRSGLSKSSFCVSGLSLKHMRSNSLHTPATVWNSGEPMVWDAVLGKNGAVITLIITPPSPIGTYAPSLYTAPFSLVPVGKYTVFTVASLHLTRS